MYVSSVDQRVFYRLATRLPVRYRFAGGSSQETACTGSAVNLSGGGMLLEAHLPDPEVVDALLADRGRIELEVHLGGRQLNILSRVVWVEPAERSGAPCQMGLRFLDLGPQEQETLWQFVLQNKT